VRHHVFGESALTAKLHPRGILEAAPGALPSLEIPCDLSGADRGADLEE
jgi:hypothetical protein